MIKAFLTDLDGCLTDGGYYTGLFHSAYHQGQEWDREKTLILKKFQTKDFKGMELLHNRYHIPIAVITGSKIPITTVRFEMASPYAEVFTNVHDKVSLVEQEFVQKRGIPFDDIAFIGDDVNDAKLLEVVGLAGCPADAHSSIITLIQARIDGMITDKTGGNGAVREFIDFIFAVNGIIK